jgi:hypothetical protein
LRGGSRANVGGVAVSARRPIMDHASGGSGKPGSIGACRTLRCSFGTETDGANVGTEAVTRQNFRRYRISWDGVRDAHGGQKAWQVCGWWLWRMKR